MVDCCQELLHQMPCSWLISVWMTGALYIKYHARWNVPVCSTAWLCSLPDSGVYPHEQGTPTVQSRLYRSWSIKIPTAPQQNKTFLRYKLMLLTILLSPVITINYWPEPCQVMTVGIWFMEFRAVIDRVISRSFDVGRHRTKPKILNTVVYHISNRTIYRGNTWQVLTRFVKCRGAEFDFEHRCGAQTANTAAVHRQRTQLRCVDFEHRCNAETANTAARALPIHALLASYNGWIDRNAKVKLLVLPTGWILKAFHHWQSVPRLWSISMLEMMMMTPKRVVYIYDDTIILGPFVTGRHY